MWVIFLLLVCISEGLWGYLFYFSCRRRLPYDMGFFLYSYLLHIVILIGSIRLLGFLFGIIFFALHLFDILDMSVGWIITFIIDKRTILRNPNQISFDITDTVPELSITALSLFAYAVYGFIIFDIIPKIPLKL
jgi:hypothetical protein